MKSVFIGFIALSTTMLIFAQMPQPAMNNQNGQAPPLLTDLNVSMAANISFNSTQAALVSSQAVTQAIQQAQVNASQAQSSASNASFWASSYLQPQIQVANSIISLMVAQANVQIAQAAQSQAMQYALIYDPINVLAGAVSTAQYSAFNQPSNPLFTAAIKLAAAQSLQISNQLVVLAAQAAQAVVNATAIQTSTYAAMQANNNVTTTTASNIASAQTVFAFMISPLVAAANTQALLCASDTATQLSSFSYSAAATTDCQLLAVKVQLIAVAADNLVIAQNAALVAANLAQNVAYGAFAASALAASNAQQASSFAGTLSYSVSNASVAQAQLAMQASMQSQTVSILASQNAVNTMNLASQKAMLSQKQCSMAQSNILPLASITTSACSYLPYTASFLTKAKLNQMAKSYSLCQAALNNINMGAQVQIQACAQ